MKKKILLIWIMLLVASGVTLAQDVNIPSDVEALAFEGVQSNGEWELYSEELNGVEMVLVPAGCFMMGSENGNDNEQPVHEICFDRPFWIDRYEVTNGQYGQPAETCTTISSEANQPRLCIDWYHALEFCEQRGARLPTEAEWEYAARGPDNLIYPWGNEFDCAAGNFDDETAIEDNVIETAGCDGFDITAPVGSFPAGVSWVGAMDMAGNVQEWAQSKDWAYPYNSTDGRETIDTTNRERVMRGGSWVGSDSSLVRSAIRLGMMPDYWLNTLGFRCARSYAETEY